MNWSGIRINVFSYWHSIKSWNNQIDIDQVIRDQKWRNREWTRSAISLKSKLDHSNLSIWVSYWVLPSISLMIFIIYHNDWSDIESNETLFIWNWSSFRLQKLCWSIDREHQRGADQRDLKWLSRTFISNSSTLGNRIWRIGCEKKESANWLQIGQESWFIWSYLSL